MKVDAFLFDLDGTLVETEAAWSHAIVDLVNGRGGRATFEEILPNVVGRNWMEIDRWFHGRYPEIGESGFEEDAAELRKYYLRYATDPSAMVIRSSAAFFRKAAAIAPCAIVSGSPHDDIVRAAEVCGIADCLKLALGAGEYAKGKPDPSGYLRAAELLGANPANCVVIEDSTVGVKSGVNAGMKVLALDRAALVQADCTGATWRVKDLAEMDMGAFA